jgi:hypothetical protein
MSAHTGRRAIHPLLSISTFAYHEFLFTAEASQRSHSACDCNDPGPAGPVLHQKNPFIHKDEEGSSFAVPPCLARAPRAGIQPLSPRRPPDAATADGCSSSALCPLECANGRTRVDLHSVWLSANRLPGDLRWMAAVGGLQPVTSLSAGPCVHQGPSTYSSCSTSFHYDGTHPPAKAGAIPCLLAALYPISPSLSSRFDNCQALEYNRSVCLMVDLQENSEGRNCREEPIRYHEKQ